MQLPPVVDANEEVKFEIKRLCLFQTADLPSCEFRDGPWTFAWVPATGPGAPTACGQPPGSIAHLGFRTPGYLQPGLTKADEDYKCDAAVGLIGTIMNYETSAGAGVTLAIFQDLRPGYDLDADMRARSATPIALGNGRAYRLSAGDKQSVIWFAGNNLIMQVTSPYVSFEEVLRVAESMR